MRVRAHVAASLFRCWGFELGRFRIRAPCFGCWDSGVHALGFGTGMFGTGLLVKFGRWV